MRIPEPTLAALPNPLARYVLATRPAFLSVTLFSCLIGLASAIFSGLALSAPAALATIVFALVAHAGVNVLNDYYDALNGSDAANTERIFPYTGGSRFIQNGLLTTGETARYGAALFGAVILAGVWLTQASGPGLVAIGLAGLVVGWAYSAPPLRLNSRGLGELCVAAGFALIVVGADFVQRQAFDVLPMIAGLSYALLVTNVLFINQFPDRRADALAGKRHWVVRLPPGQSRWGYVLIALAAHGWLLAAVLAGSLPGPALIALVSILPAGSAARDLLRYAAQPARLTQAIRRTIAAASLHGLLLAGGLAVARLLASS